MVESGTGGKGGDGSRKQTVATVEGTALTHVTPSPRAMEVRFTKGSSVLPPSKQTLSL